MVGLSEYEQWKQKQAQASVGAASVVIGAQDRGPDEVAGDLNLATEFARTTGNPQPPAPMVAEYRNVFQKAIEEKRASTILSTSPRLTEWLRDPTNAAIGRDDLEGLSWWETGLRAGGNAVSRGIQRVPQSYNQLMAATAAERAGDAERSFSEILMDSRNPVMVDGQEVSREFVGPVDLVQSGLRWFSSRVDMMGGVDQQANAVGFQRQAGEWANAIQNIPMSPAGERFKGVFADLGKSGDWKQDIRDFGAAVAADPGAFSAFLFETAAESVPSLAVATGVTAATRSPAAGAMFMGGQSALTEAGTAPVQFFQEKGIDVSTPEGALQVVSDPVLMREAMDRGVIRGTIIGALDGLSGGLAGQVLSRSPAGNMALQALAQAFLGGGGEAAAQVASGQEFNIAEVLIEGLAEFATAPIEVAGVGGRAFLDGRRKAQDAEARQAVFQELSGQAVNSKVRARMPDKFKDLVAQATANGPVENVYVPAEQFRDYFQSVGVDPYSLVEGLDGVSRDDFDAALAGGGDLQIPTSTYAAHIAGSEHDAFLMENMRFDPDEFTAAEARDFNARVDEIRAQAEEAQTAAFQEEQFWRSTEQTIYDTMVERLRIAGRSTDVATSEALLYPAFYRAMAERSQLTTEEFLQQYPLPQVQGAIPQGMQAKNVDEFTRTLAAARSFRGRRSAGGAPSLLEFIADRGGIVDRGGELKARDAATVKRGRGKKTLQLLREDMGQGSLAGMGSDTGRRYGPDDVAQAAIEAGFMADNPIVQEYRAALERGDEAPDITRALWDEIDAELRGRETVDPNAEPDQAAYFDEIEAYLDKAGVTLDDEDAAIRAAIDAFEAQGDGRAYAQAGVRTLFQKDVPQPVVGFDGTEGVTPYDIRQSDGFLQKAEAFARHEAQDNPLKALRDRARAMYFDEAGQFLASDENLSRILNRVARANYAIRELEKPAENPPEIVTVQAIVDEGDYRMQHRAPDASNGSPSHDLSEGGTYPADVYSRDGARFYASSPSSEKALKILQKLRGKPDATVTIYRSVPKGITQFNKGDWVSLTRDYAIDHGDANLGGQYDILEMKVRARDIFTNGDSLDEWGWAPAGKTYLQNESGPRGQIQIPGDGIGPNSPAIISLFETANLSTFVHESGHYFLTVMQDMAARGEPGAATDFEGVKTWWRENAAAVAADGSRVGGAAITAADVERAIDTGTTGDAAKDAAVDVGMQEQFARGFEQYLMEGRAPSAELRGAFEKFRAWMVSVYKKLTGLNVKVSDEMRGVFDRMLASDAEIARAKQEAGQSANVLPTAEAMGLTDEEYQRFLTLRDQAEQSAQARLLREIMEPVRREQAEWYKAEKAKVREAVAAEVNGMRQYRAIEWMGNRRWLDADAPEGLGDMRMSKDILVDRYGEGVLKTLPRGRQAVYAVEGGVDPDDAAGWFGFGSGDEMIRAMETAPKRSDAIRDETERRMYELHGDPMKDGAMEAAALDAVHTDRRGEWIAAELKAIAEVADTDPGLTSKQARAAARDTISRMKVRDAMNANRFLSAERKAGEEAARLGAMLAREKVWQDAARRRIAVKGRAGDVAGVPGQIDQANRSTLRRNETAQKFVQAKRRQLLNHALYMEARKVADEVGAAERYVAKLGKASTREKIAGAGRREGAQIDYLGAIDEVMTRYDFRRMSARGEDRRGALQSYVDAMTAAGRENELAIPEKVMRDAARAPYKTLPVEELRGVVDTLKNLEHVALRWNKLIDGQQQRALDEAVAGVVEGIEANLPKRPPGRVNTRMEALRNAGRQYLDLVLNASTMLREIDGFKEQGAAYQAVKAPIDAAMNRLTERRMKAAEDMDALYGVYSKAERRRMAVREFVPELGYSLSKWEKIAVALNTGNAGNLQRMTDPKVRGSMTQDQVDAILRTLDERDAAFIQSVWDYVGSFRADIAAREKRTTGVEPAWVEASPVTIAGRTLTGGYYPLKYDPRLSSLARDDQANEIAQSLQSGRFGKAQTKNGHTKERATSSGRAVDLDMSVLHRHVQQVIHDLELSEPVANSWRILQNGQVRDALRNAGRAADFDAMEIWLKDVAEGQVNAGDWVSVAARTAKSNFTAAKLALNLSTVAMQVTGVAQTMVVVGKKDFALGVQSMFRQGVGGIGQVGQEVAAKSSFMRERQTTFNKDIYDFYNDPKLGPTASRWGDFKREIWGPLSFWLMTKVQYYSVDLPSWLAGYQKGLRDYGGDEARAIALADDMVKRAQASGLFSDAPAIQRGSLSAQTRQNAVVRLFTTLGSYMFAKFNVAYERSLTGAREVAGAETRAKAVIASLSWAADMAFLFTLEAVVIAAIKGRLPDEEEDEDDTWGKFLAKETAMGVMGTLPFVRDVASTMGGFEGGGAYGGITKEIAEPFKQAVQGEVDAGLVKSIISATGLATGIPSTQINRAVDAGWREVAGQEVSPLEYFLGKMGK